MTVAEGQAEILAAWRAYMKSLTPQADPALTPQADAAWQAALLHVIDNVDVPRDPVSWDDRPPRPVNQSWLPVFA